MARPSTLLVSILDDPRRIDLRPTEYFNAYSQRGATEDIIEISHDLTKLRRIDLTRMRVALSVCQQPAVLRSQHLHDRDYPLQPAVSLPNPAIPDESFNELLHRRRRPLWCPVNPLSHSPFFLLPCSRIWQTPPA